MQPKWWGIFFGVVLLASFLLCAVSPFVGWTLPQNIASYGGEVDYLYYVILGLTTFFFVLTEVLMVYAMVRYTYRPNHKSDYVEGNHRLELLWSIVPAGILLFIAFAQIKTWDQIKYHSHMPTGDMVLQVSARQWDWTMRYPNEVNLSAAESRSWSNTPEADDIYLPDELHCWKDADVKIYLKTQDVLHSFFLPNLRLKQDALPGKTIPMWFKATDSNTRFNEKTGKCELTDKNKEWEIACAELCGGGHYRMRGLLYVHETKEDYLKWLDHAKKAQRSREPEKKTAIVAADR